MRSFWFLWLCWVTSCHAVQLIRITDIKCLSVDETFLKFTKCFTKLLSKTTSETSFNVTLLQELKKASVKTQFRKKSNGKYNPYFHGDVLFDACKFMSNRAISPMGNYLLSIVEDFTNVNHSCPFKDYIVMDRFRVDMNKFKWLPAPPGDFFINCHFMLNDKKRCEIGIYFNFSE